MLEALLLSLWLGASPSVATDDDWSTLLTGRAVDAEGKPIPGLTLELADFDEYTVWEERPRCVTDEAGRFRFGPHELATYTTILFGSTGDGRTLIFSRAAFYLDSRADDLGDLFCESIEPWLRGLVVDEAGVPIENAQVVAYNKACRVFAQTDAEGRFAIGGIAPFDVRVDGRSGDVFSKAIERALDEAGNPREVTLVIPETTIPRPPRPTPFRRPPPPTLPATNEGFSLAFHVTSPDGADLKNARIDALWSKEAIKHPYADGVFSLPTTRSDDLGTASFPSVPAGQVRISFHHRGYPSLQLDLAVPGDVEKRARQVRLEQGAWIVGRVREDGKLLAGFDGYRRSAHIESGSSRGYGTYWYFLDQHGEFRAGPLLSGRYSLAYYDDVPIRSVDVFEGEKRLVKADDNFSPFLDLREGQTRTLELRIVK